jgi:hypothetical protein
MYILGRIGRAILNAKKTLRLRKLKAKGRIHYSIYLTSILKKGARPLPGLAWSRVNATGSLAGANLCLIQKPFDFFNSKLGILVFLFFILRLMFFDLNEPVLLQT